MLINGQTYMLGVKNITPAADHFTPREGGLKFCHYFDLVDEHGEVYPFQICDEKDMQSYCTQGDTVKVKVKTYTKGRYTTESIIVVSPANAVSKPPATMTEFAKEVTKFPVPPTYEMPAEVRQQVLAVAPSSNGAVALECSVKFYSNNPVADVNNPSKSIIDLAKEFHKFLQSHK